MVTDKLNSHRSGEPGEITADGSAEKGSPGKATIGQEGGDQWSSCRATSKMHICETSCLVSQVDPFFS